MTALGPVLVATDFSPYARHAAERAARVAHEASSPLTLMHVLSGDALAQLRAWLGQDSAAELRMREDAGRQLGELADALRAARHVRVDVLEAAGPVIDEILRVADARDAGLVVTGARGEGFLRRLLLGTTSERLMRRTTRPLLVVRQKPHEPYRRVLVPVDFSAWSRHALAVARRVAPSARLVVMTAFTVPFESKLRFAGVEAATLEHYRQQTRIAATQQVHDLAARAGLKQGHWQPCVREGDASLRILEAEQEFDCDLVVMGKHGQSATVDLLLGSTTKHVLAEGGADVLVSTGRDA